MTDGARDIHVNASPDTVWEALVAQGHNHWYFKLDVEGAFQPGSHVVWKLPGGELAEEADVLVADSPSRLELRTRFLFAPNLAGLPAHTVRWEIEPEPGGSRVAFSWSASPAVANLLESDGEGILRGLRLAVDPSAMAELARLPEIGEVKVLDLTPERVGDYQSFFDHDAFRDFPAWQSCYCMETHRTQTDEEWSARSGADNRADMSEMISRGQVTGLLAYVDGKPVGWCNYGETTHLSGVMMKLKLLPREHDSIGAIACFVIAAQYRRHGVATKLLETALDRLRRRGVKTVEAYPRREGDGSDQGHYRGSLSMFEQAGFKPYRELAHNVIVRKTFD